jgi:hypothetical protein
MADDAIVTDTKKAQDMLAIVRGVRDGAGSIMGSSWTVYDDMAALAEAGKVDGMIEYYKAYKRSATGIRLRQRLETFGKKTLESQERQFMALARAA